MLERVLPRSTFFFRNLSQGVCESRQNFLYLAPTTWPIFTLMDSTSLGQRFVDGLSRKDSSELLSILSPEVDFRGMTPGRFWEAQDSTAVVNDILLGEWFEPTDSVSEVLAVETAEVGHRNRVGYRLIVENPDGRFLVEQQAYYEQQGNQIGWLRVMCCGMLQIQ